MFVSVSTCRALDEENTSLKPNNVEEGPVAKRFGLDICTIKFTPAVAYHRLSDKSSETRSVNLAYSANSFYQNSATHSTLMLNVHSAFLLCILKR